MRELYGIVGLCSRARQCQFGEMALAAVREGKARLVILDGSASANTQKRYGNACAFHDVPLILRQDMQEVAQAAGKPAAKVIAVINEGFAQKIVKLNGN